MPSKSDSSSASASASSTHRNATLPASATSSKSASSSAKKPKAIDLKPHKKKHDAVLHTNKPKILAHNKIKPSYADDEKASKAKQHIPGLDTRIAFYAQSPIPYIKKYTVQRSLLFHLNRLLAKHPLERLAKSLDNIAKSSAALDGKTPPLRNRSNQMRSFKRFGLSSSAILCAKAFIGGRGDAWLVGARRQTQSHKAVTTTSDDLVQAVFDMEQSSRLLKLPKN